MAGIYLPYNSNIHGVYIYLLNYIFCQLILFSIWYNNDIILSVRLHSPFNFEDILNVCHI